VSPVPLSVLPAGTVARFHEAHLDLESQQLLRALGLAARCLLRVCRHGDPCIVQVRAARIGLSKAVAQGVFVIPEAADRVA
jgi:Fe2+ transport system protein FeoA